MRFSVVRTLAAVIVLGGAYGAVAQERFADEFGGRFRGFTKSPTEHMMNEFEGVPEMRSVRGRIVDPTGFALPKAIFEIRAEDPNGKVRGVRPNQDGEFHFPSVPEGIYVFKATLNGFQSVYGKLRVTRKAPRKNALRIELQFGV